MVSTRNSPQKKTRPTGVPTVSGQARVRAEHAKQRAKQQRAAAMRANAPPIEEARRPIEEEEVGDNNKEDLTILMIGALLLVLLYLQLIYFQLSLHSYLFEGEDDTVALIPLSWALIEMVSIL